MATVLPIIFLAALGMFPTQQPVSPPPVSAAHTSAAAVLLQDTTAAKTESSTSRKKKKKNKKEATSSRITMTRDVTRATLIRKNEEGDNNNKVEIIVMSSGMPVHTAEDLQLIGNSGTTVSSGSYMGFDNISVPFEGYVRFKAPNKMKTVLYDREVRFVVTEPGHWTVRVDI